MSKGGRTRCTIPDMRILLFDIDGTLLLTNGGGSGALQIALQEEFGLDSACTNVSFSGRTDRSLLCELLARNALPSDDQHRQRLSTRYTLLLPSVLAQRGGRVLPGAAELLSRLSDEPSILTYVMTGNLQETATRKLEHFHLLPKIRGVFGGDSDADRDDLARRARANLVQLHGPEAVQDMIVIGDTPADVRCGHAIGARVLAVCTGSHDRTELQAENPMRVEDDLSDVDRIFELLVSRETET